MDNRKDRLKKSLGISEYPWSSDDDESETPHTNPLNLVRRQAGDAPRPSLGEIPGTSHQPPASSSPIDSPGRKAQAKIDREMFWSIINNRPTKLAAALARSRVYEAGASSPSYSTRLSSTASPAAERREPRQDRSSSADVQRILARWKSRDEFIRFTKSLNAMRGNRHNTNVYPVYSRNTSGPSRNPLFNQSMPSDAPVIKSNIKSHYPKRLYSSRPVYSSRSGRSAVSSPGAAGAAGAAGAHEPRPAASAASPPRALPLNPAPEDLHPEVYNVDLSDDDLVGLGPSTSGRQPATARDSIAGPCDRSLGDNNEAELPHDTSGETASDEPSGPAHAAPPADNVDGPARHKRDEEAGEAGPSTSERTREKRKRDDSEEGTEPFTVKEFNQSLLRLLECPVCLEWMEPPIAQCRRGHLVCNGCRARLAACPVCRTTFSSVRNRAMEGVAELLRYPCRHGCGREVRLRRRAPHEASCTARKYQCVSAACAQRAPLAHHDLQHHFQSKHLDLLKIGRKHKFSMKVNSEHHDDWIIMALHEFFHLRVDVDVRSWGVVFYVAYIGPKSNAHNYTYNITINGPHNSRKLSYARVTHSDLERSSLNMSRQDCFHLTLDQALNFLRFKNRHCDPDKYLDFYVEITKTEDMEEGKETPDT